MHIRYEQFEATQMVEDQDVKAMLDRTKDRKAACKVAIQKAQERQKKYEAEQRRITDITARFGSFLKHNAILPYCDSVKEYLQLSLREASRIADETNEEYYFNKANRLRV